MPWGNIKLFLGPSLERYKTYGLQRWYFRFFFGMFLLDKPVSGISLSVRYFIKTRFILFFTEIFIMIFINKISAWYHKSNILLHLKLTIISAPDVIIYWNKLHINISLYSNSQIATLLFLYPCCLSSGCYNKYNILNDFLKKQKFIFNGSGSWKVQVHDTCRFGVWWGQNPLHGS